MRKMFQNGPLLIGLGVLFIGFGGILGTLGWNRVSTNSQKRNIVASVIRECESNKKMIDEAIALIESPDFSSWSFSYRPYSSTHLSMLLTSGLFDFTGTEALAVRAELEKYEEAIYAFNAGLRIVGRHNPGLFIKTEFIHNPQRLRETQVDSVLSDKFMRLKTTSENVLALLLDKNISDKF